MSHLAALYGASWAYTTRNALPVQGSWCTQKMRSWWVPSFLHAPSPQKRSCARTAEGQQVLSVKQREGERKITRSIHRDPSLPDNGCQHALGEQKKKRQKGQAGALVPDQQKRKEKGIPHDPPSPTGISVLTGNTISCGTDWQIHGAPWPTTHAHRR